jgi:hypothetical protein
MLLKFCFVEWHGIVFDLKSLYFEGVNGYCLCLYVPEDQNEVSTLGYLEFLNS